MSPTMMLNNSQMSLNFHLLELYIPENERLDEDAMNVTERLQTSLEHEAIDQLQTSPQHEANDQMQIDVHNERIDHFKIGESRDQRRPVKERLGYRKEKTPLQNRLRNRSKVTNNAQSVKKLYNKGSCNKYSNKQFHVKRIYYENDKQATPGKIVQNMHKDFDLSVPPLATSNSGRTRPPPASSRPPMPVPGPPPTYNFPPPSCRPPIPAPVPPPIYNIPPPTIHRPLTDYMVKSLAADWIATATLKTGFTFKTRDVEKAIKDMSRM